MAAKAHVKKACFSYSLCECVRGKERDRSMESINAFEHIKEFESYEQ
jgi:hypothetical protein